MAEYIERTAAYSLAKKICDAIDKVPRCILGKDILNFIDDIPAADVRPVVRGHWTTEHLASTRGGTYPVVRCSVCGASLPFFKGTTYCPNCGARMEES